MVGWSCATEEANSEAPMLSPAASSTASPPADCAAARSDSTVPANFTVLASIRPWKSLMFSNVRSTGPAGGGVPRSSPRTTGSWSEEAYGESS